MSPLPEGAVKCNVFLQFLQIRIRVHLKQLLIVCFKQVLFNATVALSGKKLSQYQAGISNVYTHMLSDLFHL